MSVIGYHQIWMDEEDTEKTAFIEVEPCKMCLRSPCWKIVRFHLHPLRYRATPVKKQSYPELATAKE